MLVIGDLEVKEEFFPLLLLAPRKKLRATIKEMARGKERLDPSLQKYINRVYYLKYDEVKDMTEMDNLLDEKTRLSIKHFLEDHDWEDKAIDTIGPEKFIERFGIEKLAETIGLEKMKKLVEKMEKEK